MLLIRTAGSGNWFAVGIPSGGNWTGATACARAPACAHASFRRGV